MSDFSKLKKLAEDYIRLIDDPDEDLWAEARDMYEDASDADTILALIKENESLRKDAERWRMARSHGVLKKGKPMDTYFVYNEQADEVIDAYISSPENP